jgi:hypothetical protein
MVSVQGTKNSRSIDRCNAEPLFAGPLKVKKLKAKLTVTTSVKDGESWDEVVL